MACERCEQLMLEFTEELGEFILINHQYFLQLEQEKQDDFSDRAYELIQARLAQGMKLFELVKEISVTAIDGHDEGDSQLDLFAPSQPKLPS